MKKWTLLCVFLATGLVLSRVHALDVSVQVIQRDKGLNRVIETSYFVEDIVMECMFDMGYVTSNLPVEQVDDRTDLNGLCTDNIFRCSEGSADYYAMILLDIDMQNTSNPEAVLMSQVKNVNWSVYNVSTGNVLKSGEIDTKNTKYDNSDRGVKKLAQNVSRLINESLNNR